MAENVLYKNEQAFINTLEYFWADTSAFCILGDSGCGKSFTIRNYFSDNKKDYIFLEFAGDYLYDDRDYYVFLKALSLINQNSQRYLKEGIKELSKDIPVFSNIASYITESIVNLDNDNLLNATEQEIIGKIEYLIKDKKTVLFFDDFHWWDKRSIQLLSILIREKKFIEKYIGIKVIFTMTTNQSFLHKECIEDLLRLITLKKLIFPILEYNDFKNLLRRYVYRYDNPEQQLRILYNLIGNHMKILSEVIRELERGENILNIACNDGKEYLNQLLERRLKEYGADGELIAYVLEYASVIGLTFSYLELERITRINSLEFKKIICKATTLELIEENSSANIATFAHQIVRELFESRVQMNSNISNYYITIEKCLSTIKPSEYLRRARYLVKAGELDDATTLYILELLQQLRTYGYADTDVESEAMPLFKCGLDIYYDYMKKAYETHRKKQYDETLDILDLIEEFYPSVLVAEKRLLQSYCYTKSLNEEIRRDSLYCIQTFQDLQSVGEEIEVYERIQNRLISVYAHLGEISKAKDIEYRLMQNLGQRFPYDGMARTRLNIVRRNANILHDCKSSMIIMERAVNYFGPQAGEIIPQNLKQYYISLVNYSSILVQNGLYEKALSNMNLALLMEKEFSNYLFPRRQILYNNYTICSYMCHKQSVLECIASLEKIVESLPVIAERLTYTSNLSVFYALEGQVLNAIEILQKEIDLQQVDKDVEGFYKFRSYTNLAIFNHLLSNTSNALRYLEKVEPIIPTLNNGVYFQKHHDIIKAIITDNQYHDNIEWEKCVHEQCPHFKTDSWKYFGYGYILASLTNWDTES